MKSNSIKIAPDDSVSTEDIMVRNVSLLWVALNEEDPGRYPASSRSEFISRMTQCAMAHLDGTKGGLR